MTDRHAPLWDRMHELKDLEGVLGLLSWDEETYAPSGARPARGRQTGTVEALRHQRLVDPAVGEQIQVALADPTLSEERRLMAKRLERQRNLAVKVPESLVKAFAEARSTALEAWQKAKKEQKFSLMEKELKEVLRLLAQKADALGSATGVKYDALLDEYEPEMTVATLRPLFTQLRAGLVPLVERIAKSGRRPDTSFLAQRYDDQKQWDFTMLLLRDLGFDLERGRQDRSSHPFTSAAAPSDVRVTTRIFENNPSSAIFSTIHECGHGLYEQGFARDHDRTTLAAAPSMGIHESQSRLWENQIGRSRAFWAHYLPMLKASFPTQLAKVDLEAFHRAINVVEPSLVRVEADEVTYNLHIIVRFELEQALLSGDLPVAELPAAWNAKMKEVLGVTPAHDAEGCMQDIHWAWGAIGYFPTYTLGNLYAAQLVHAYERHHPGLWDDVAKGNFAPLLGWLRANIHRRGFTASAQQIVGDAVGGPLEIESFLGYLRHKYHALYEL